MRVSVGLILQFWWNASESPHQKTKHVKISSPIKIVFNELLSCHFIGMYFAFFNCSNKRWMNIEHWSFFWTKNMWVVLKPRHNIPFSFITYCISSCFFVGLTHPSSRNHFSILWIITWHIEGNCEYFSPNQRATSFCISILPPLPFLEVLFYALLLPVKRNNEMVLACFFYFQDLNAE